MPGVKCGVCSKFMSPTDGVKCTKCNNIYHRSCVELQTGFVASSWRCFECRKKASGEKVTGISATPAVYSKSSEPSPSLMNDINVELRRFREELRTVRSEFQAFREEVALGLRGLTDRVDALEQRVISLEGGTGYAGADLSSVVAQLKQDLNDRDQDLLGNDIEITMMPESSSENLIHTVKLVATKIGVNIEDTDIVSADRVGGRHINATASSGPTQSRPRAIVVRLARRDTRDAILRAARVRRNINTTDLNLPGHPKRLYINERLTKQNRALFRQARDAGKQSGWRYIWTSRGRILARCKEGDAACRIRNEADILQVFGIGAEDRSKQTN